MRLVTNRLILRDIESNDAKSLIKNANNLKISREMLAIPYPYTMKDARWFINHVAEKKKKRPMTSYNFVIQLKKHDGIIGGLGIQNVNRKQKTAEIGYWIGEDYWGNSYGREAINRILKYAFDILKLKKIIVTPFEKNALSNNLVKKLGGKFMGKAGPVTCLATGKKHKENVYHITPANWKKKLNN